MFWLTDSPDERLRLKQFSASSKGATATIRIVLETTDTYAMAQALEDLKKVQAGQKERPPAKPRTAKPAIEKPQRTLALPAPDGKDTP